MARLTLILGVLATVIYLLDGFRFVVNEWRNWRNKIKQTGTWMTIAFLLGCSVSNVNGQTIYPSASCSSTDINAAIALATDGDTVTIPACAETTMTASIAVTNKGITLIGAGEGVTNLKDGAVTTEPFSLKLTTTTALMRLSGLTFNANDNVTSNYSSITIFGTGLDKFRVDHVTVTNVKSRAVSVNGNLSGTGSDEFTGLIDHVTCHNTSAVGSPQCFNVNGSWSATNVNAYLYDQQPGTNHLTYIEDSTCLYTSPADACIDSPRSGGNVVFRYNTIDGIGLGFHGADSNQRGMHLIELYRNTFSKGSGALVGMMNYRSGPYVSFDNAWTGQFISGSIALQIYRARVGNVLTGAPGVNCDGLSSWDGNIIGFGSSGQGYPCLDQVGWYFPGITANGANAIQRPAYMFNNTLDGVDTIPAAATADEVPYITNNVDFYTTVSAACSGASCTTGVGYGLLSARPATCTIGVGYWATDQGSWNVSGNGDGSGVLYTCTATNTWSVYYTPYTYPHPLQGTTETVAPSPVVIARVLRWMEVAALVTGMGWHFRKPIMAVSLAAITGCGTLYQLAPYSYETVKGASKDSAVKILMVFNHLTKPRM